MTVMLFQFFFCYISEAKQSPRQGTLIPKYRPEVSHRAQQASLENHWISVVSSLSARKL